MPSVLKLGFRFLAAVSLCLLSTTAVHAASEIKGTLGGVGSTDVFKVEDNSNSPLLKVTGDGQVTIGDTSNPKTNSNLEFKDGSVQKSAASLSGTTPATMVPEDCDNENTCDCPDNYYLYHYNVECSDASTPIMHVMQDTRCPAPYDTTLPYGVVAGCPVTAPSTFEIECGHCFAGSDTYKFVFVTSETHDGNLGGLAGADAICDRLGDTYRSGTYKAWLSTGGADAPAFTFVRSAIPYKLRDGTTVADNWTDLTDSCSDNCIQNAINIDETGALVSSREAWTNTTVTGAATTTTSDCNDWTSNGSGDWGRTGDVDVVSEDWTSYESRTCNNAVRRLYCFEQ